MSLFSLLTVWFFVAAVLTVLAGIAWIAQRGWLGTHGRRFFRVGSDRAPRRGDPHLVEGEAPVGVGGSDGYEGWLEEPDWRGDVHNAQPEPY